jgi:hypothetical protein
MEEITLSEKSIKALASEIVKRFMQAAEHCCTGNEAGALGVVLADHYQGVLERQQKQRKEKDRARRIDALNNRVQDVPRLPHEENDLQRPVLDVDDLNANQTRRKIGTIK